MEPKSYPAEKRKVLAHMSADQLLAFALQVKPGHLKAWAKPLKPVTGFRTGSAPEIEQRVKQYLRRRAKWAELDWNLFKDLWADWVRSHAELNTVLQAFDNSTDSGPDGHTALQNTDLDIRCFEHLAEANASGLVSRETIQKFYEFGYFVIDERIERLIRLTKSETELRLPREIEAVKVLVGELGEKHDKDLSLLQRTIDRELKVRADKVEKAVDNLDSMVKSEKATRERLSDRLQVLTGEMSEQRKQSNQRESQIRKELEQQVEQGLRNLTQQVSALKDSMSQLQQNIDTRLTTTTPLTTTEALNVVSPLAAPHMPAGVAVELDYASAEAAGNPFTDQELLIERLSENFRSTGLKQKSAHPLAAEVVACLLAGQIALFRGSLASILVDIAARTLACAARFDLRIPVGLLDGRSFQPLLHEVADAAAASGQMTALVLDGINLSAVEVYGRGLRQLLSNRLIHRNKNDRNLLLFGTVLDGAAALPITPEFRELGPLFDTDCLSIIDIGKPRPMTHGTVDPGVWSTWAGEAEVKQDGWEDAMDLFSKLSRRVSPMWRRALLTAHSALWSPDTEPQYWPTPVQSIAFGWMIPWLKLEGALSEDVKEKLQGGKLDGDKPDSRIVRWLRSEGVEG